MNCKKCGKEFELVSRLKIHKEKAICVIDSAGILSAQELSSMTCATCGYRPANANDLRKHKRRLACNLPSRKCEICGKKFSHSSQLIRHKQNEVCTIDSAGVLSENEPSSMKCDMCGLTFAERTNLRKHKKTKHAAKMFRFFSRPSQIQLHPTKIKNSWSL